MWIEIESSDSFINGIAKLNIDDDQVEMIRLGFNGKAYPHSNKTGGIFPFGVHKNKPMDEVPLEYYSWAMNQDWLHKWPTVQAYIEEHKEEILQGKKDYKSALQELSNLKESLK